MNTTIDTYIVHGFLQFGLWRTITCKFCHRNCIIVKVQEKSVAVKGEALFLVKGQWLFNQPSRRSEYRLYCSASTLQEVQLVARTRTV